LSTDSIALLRLQEILGYQFKDPLLLRNALIHPSFNEHKSNEADNQRLEFLGDSVLGLVLSTTLYESFPAADEGELSQRKANLARGECLAKLAQELELQSYVLMSAAEKKQEGHLRSSTLEDAIEAVIGAIFIDGGFTCAKRVIMCWMRDLISSDHDDKSSHNPKGVLQEWVQENLKDAKLRYFINNENGPPHDKRYRASVKINGEVFGEGEGKSKKSAEFKAAEDALSKLFDANMIEMKTGS
jgi:ribonuclease-3